MNGAGYWLVAKDGGIFTFGNASFQGASGNNAVPPTIVSMTRTPDNGGYWLVTPKGQVVTYGDAAELGSTEGDPLGGAIVAVLG